MATYMSMPWKPPQELQYQQPQGQPLPGLPPIVQGPSLQVGQGLTRPYQPTPEQSFTLGGQPATPSPWVSVPGSAFPNAGMEYQTAAPKAPPLPLGSGGVVTPPPPGGLKSPPLPLGNGGVTTPTPGLNSGGGKVVKNADGSWSLPNGTVIPASAQTTIQVNGQSVVLPFYNGNGMPGRGDYRFTINGHQEDALTFLARRLTDAAKRGLNVQDPNVIYDEMSRIRDDMLAAGVPAADLDRASGIGGLGNFVRSQQPDTAPPGAPGAPPPVAPPAPPVAPPATPPKEDPVTQQKPGDPTGNGGNAPLGTPTTYGATTLSQPVVTATGLASDPTMAGRFVRMAQGLTGPTTSRMGKLRDQLYGRMLAAYLNLSGPGQQPTDLSTFISQLQSGNIIPAVQAQARQGLAAGAGTGLDDTTMEQLLGYASALGGVGTGSIGQAGLDFGLQGLLTGQMDEDITTGGADTTPLYKRYANSPFKSALERYLQTVTQH